MPVVMVVMLAVMKPGARAGVPEPVPRTMHGHELR